MPGSFINSMTGRITRDQHPFNDWIRLGPTLRPLSANRKIENVAVDALRRPRFAHELHMLSMCIDA